MVKRKKDLGEIVHNILRDMYKHSTPSADLDELIRNGEAQQEGFYNRYYIEDMVAKTIFDKWVKTKKLKSNEINTVAFNVWLGASPCSNKDTTNRARAELGLTLI
jgi:hypothetical protein